MKRPQHMTMRELIALPVVEDLDTLLDESDPTSGRRVTGGAFADDDGLLWATRRLNTGWVRHPAYLSILIAQAIEDRDEREDRVTAQPWTFAGVLGKFGLGQGARRQPSVVGVCAQRAAHPAAGNVR